MQSGINTCQKSSLHSDGGRQIPVRHCLFPVRQRGSAAGAAIGELE
jgi:hypothetical protein